jgi:enoyl-CoA hydratase/carnithine racemase
VKLPLYFLAVGGGTLIQSTVVPVLGFWGVVPDFPVVLVVLLALRRGPEVGCVVGFALGLAQDVIAGGPLGLQALSKPSIALIKGYCVGGGCELATFADIRVAAANARLGIPPARLGIALGYREMQRLVQLVGPGRASYIIFSARLLDAQEALRIGLVDQVVPLAEIDGYTLKLAQEVTALSPVSHRANKAIIRTALANPSLQGLTPEQEALPYSVFDSEDYREGRRAFVEKRRSQFQGR